MTIGEQVEKAICAKPPYFYLGNEEYTIALMKL
jgi:hypothetical protein